MDTTNNTTSFFPPVVAVLGHVDHGKTSLLDAIRSSSVAEREVGGITQKIGASTIEIEHDGKKRRITFIDTPGHEAFSKMRSRGAGAADIGILVISSGDGIMPQTRESIHSLKAAQIPYIVALTKADLPTKNVESVKQQLMQEEVVIEEYGGDVPVIEVSSRTGQNIKELLDLILLVYEVRVQPEQTASAAAPFAGIVIESKLDQKSGPRATVVIKNGTVKPRDDIKVDATVFRVRTLLNDLGQQVKEASVGEAVEILGMTKVPSVGSVVTDKATDSVAPLNTKTAVPLTKEMVFSLEENKDRKLAVILSADTQGSMEAIIAALPEDITIVAQKTGEITEADILLAKSTGAIVLSFNVRIRTEVQKLASTEKVLAKNYTIIYEMLDEIKDVLEGKQFALLEEIYGTARILAKFPFEKTFVMGITVLDGRVARGDKIRLLRQENVLGEATITSLRIGKDSTSKVEKGGEAGIITTPILDFQPGDAIICHS